MTMRKMIFIPTLNRCEKLDSSLLLDYSNFLQNHSEFQRKRVLSATHGGPICEREQVLLLLN